MLLRGRSVSLLLLDIQKAIFDAWQHAGGTTIATTILFVYGTLKRGLRNHRLIADQTFLGEVTTEPRYRVIDLGPFPGLIVDEVNGLAVQGELWAVSECCLAELDEFEGVAGPFI